MMNTRVGALILLVQSSGAVPDCAKGVGTPCLPPVPQQLSAKYPRGPDSREYVRRFSERTEPFHKPTGWHSCTYTEPFGCAEMALSDEGSPYTKRAHCGQCDAVTSPYPGYRAIAHFCSDDGAWVTVFQYVDEDCTILGSATPVLPPGREYEVIANSPRRIPENGGMGYIPTCSTWVVEGDRRFDFQADGCSAEAPPCKAVNNDAEECSGWTDEKCLDQPDCFVVERVFPTGRFPTFVECCKGGPEKVAWNIMSSEITEASSGPNVTVV